MKFHPLYIMSAINLVLTNELRRPKYRGLKNRLAGHCYVATEALYHMAGGKRYGFKPMFIRHENEPHWFLQSFGGAVYDITAEQFDSAVKYENAKGKGFLTRRPSKRAKIVIQRAEKYLDNLTKRFR